jgi:hypothetical protein
VEHSLVEYVILYIFIKLLYEFVIMWEFSNYIDHYQFNVRKLEILILA